MSGKGRCSTPLSSEKMFLTRPTFIRWFSGTVEHDGRVWGKYPLDYSENELQGTIPLFV